MDFCDHGARTEAREREAALSLIANRPNGRGPEWIDGRPCCRECGEEIPSRRLEVVPDAETCVGCG